MYSGVHLYTVNEPKKIYGSVIRVIKKVTVEVAQSNHLYMYYTIEICMQ